MNMRIFNYRLLAFALLLAFSSCRKQEVKHEYGVNTVDVLPNNIDKTRLKTTDQYVAILYANLFQKALSGNQLYTISQCFDSVGDQILARQMIIANFMGQSGVILPTTNDMRADIPKFIEETYVKFYVRHPSEAEKEFLKQMIIADPKITAELVYFSFALSDEYMYY
jgi:hypothetical protein